MKRLILFILLGFLIPGLIALATASYSANIVVTNNSTTNYPMLPIQVANNNTNLIAHGFMIASGLDSSVKLNGGRLPYMASDNSIYFAAPTSPTSSNTYQFVTGQTAANFSIVTGNGGYVTTNDTAALELGDNYTLKLKCPIVASANGTTVYLSQKDGAFNIFESPTVSGNVTANITSYTSSQILLPDGAGDATNITNVVGAATHWQAVSDNSDASYVSTASVGYLQDLYTLSNTSLPAGAVINSVVIYVRLGPDIGSSVYETPHFKIGANVYTGTEQSTTVIADKSQTYTTSPATGLAWTSGEIDGMQIGVSIKGNVISTPTAEVMKEWVVVNYTLAGYSLTVTGVSASDQSVQLQSDGVNSWLSVGSINSANHTSIPIPDTANNYIFSEPYYDYIKMTIGGIEKLWYQPNTIISGTTLPDRDGTKNGDITWGSNPAQLTASISNLVSSQMITSNVTSSSYLGNYLPGTVPGYVNPSLADAETAVEHDWLYDFIKPFADTSGTPAVFFYWMGTIIVAIAGFLLAYKTKHLLISAIAFDVPFGYGIAKGYIPWWVIILLAIWTIGSAIQEARM
jgi:hypothetical protein